MLKSVLMISTLLAAGAAMLVGPITPANAQRAVVGNDTSAASVKGQTWDHFAELVEQRLGDEMDVQVTHGSALYDQNTLVQALQLGSLQFISPVVGVYSGLFPKLTVLVLPYMLPSPEAIREAMEDPLVGGQLIDEMRGQGFEPLAIWLNGPRDVGITGGEPVMEPEDMRGVKIRVPPGQNYVAAWDTIGANVTTMSWGEVPTALQQGVIDAVEPTPNAWYGSHLYEVADQITRTEYIWDFYIVSTNKDWWEGLDPDVRDGLQAAMDEATEWNWQHTDETNREAYEKIREAGAEIHDLTPEQKQVWVEAMQPLWTEVGLPLVGEEVLDRLVSIGEKHRAEAAAGAEQPADADRD